MLDVQFLSDAWIAALDRAARAHTVAPDGPLADVSVTIAQEITDGPSWRLVIDAGSISVSTEADPPADVRLISDRATATAIARGERAALEAFIHGNLVLGGDAGLLLEHRAALETFADLFAAVKADTEFT